MHACSSANLSMPLRTWTWLIFYHLMSIILIFRRLWTIPIWILFCYKRRASIPSLRKTSIGLWWRNQRPWACSLMFISVFLYVIFWHSKRWPIVAWSLKITSFSLEWRIFFKAGRAWASSSPEISELMIANRNLLSRAIKSVITALQTDGDRRGVRKIESQLRNNATPNTHLFFFLKEIKF
jgi:hypothetical protein